jgi:3-dehydroquinate synthase
MSADFLIENKIFSINDNFCSQDSFTVKSVPKNYNVTVKNDAFPEIEIQNLLDENKNNLLLIDKKVYNLYFKNINIAKNRIFLADASETFKTLDGVRDVIAFLEKNEFTKSEKLIIVGGGIIEDVGAFVGACFKRGIKWIYYRIN